MLPHGLFRSLCRCAAIKHYRNLHRDTVGCYDQRGIQVHVALRDAARGMSKEIRDRKFGKAEVARNAGEGMAEHMRGHVLEFRLSAKAVEDADHANEMPISPVGRKDEEGTLLRRTSLTADFLLLIWRSGQMFR
jgi:hypothetical protein